MIRMTTLPHIALFTLAVAMGACTLQKVDDAADYREALPVTESVSVSGPGASGEGSSTKAFAGHTGLLDTSGSGAPAVAEWYAFTRNVRDGVNVVTRDVLMGVWAIARTPPRQVGVDFAEWGPFTDALDPVAWRLHIDRLPDATFAYRLDGRPRASQAEGDYRAVLRGTGYGRTDARHGDGSFSIDLDAAKALDPVKHPNDSGKLTITHDLPADIAQNLAALPRTIQAQIDPSGEAWVTIKSVSNVDGTGSLEVNAHTDVDASNATLLEDVSVESRYHADGAGRADLVISGGNLPASIPLVSGSECWNTSFVRVYYSDSQNFKPTYGDPTACVEGPASSP